jgi:hypothetical protein
MFRAKALRLEAVSSVDREKQMCFYASEYESDRVIKIYQEDGFSRNKV